MCRYHDWSESNPNEASKREMEEEKYFFSPCANAALYLRELTLDLVCLESKCYYWLMKVLSLGEEALNEGKLSQNQLKLIRCTHLMYTDVTTTFSPYH